MAPTPTIDLPGSCPVEYQPPVAQRLLILKCLERLMVEGRRHSLPRYGTDHDSEPLSSFPAFRLPTRTLQCEQKEH